jgi:hypothetical protein
MKITMLQSTKGAADGSGSTTRIYAAGEEMDAKLPWQKVLASAFVDAGVAEETKVVAPTETKVSTPEPGELGTEVKTETAPQPQRRKKKR